MSTYYAGEQPPPTPDQLAASIAATMDARVKDAETARRGGAAGHAARARIEGRDKWLRELADMARGIIRDGDAAAMYRAMRAHGVPTVVLMLDPAREDAR